MKDLIIAIGLIYYIVSIVVNYILIDKYKLFDTSLNYKFTLLYIVLSPFVLGFSIGQAMITKYQNMRDMDTIIKTIIVEIEDTKYESLSYNEIEKLVYYMAEHTEYSVHNSFEEMFEAFEEDKVIVKNAEGNYMFNTKIGQEE